MVDLSAASSRRRCGADASETLCGRGYNPASPRRIIKEKAAGWAARRREGIVSFDSLGEEIGRGESTFSHYIAGEARCFSTDIFSCYRGFLTLLWCPSGRVGHHRAPAPAAALTSLGHTANRRHRAATSARAAGLLLARGRGLPPEASGEGREEPLLRPSDC